MYDRFLNSIGNGLSTMGNGLQPGIASHGCDIGISHTS